MMVMIIDRFLESWFKTPIIKLSQDSFFNSFPHQHKKILNKIILWNFLSGMAT